jgi:hypothetical protein
MGYTNIFVLDFKLSSYQPDHQEGDEQLDNQPLPHVKSLRYYLIPIRLMALAVVLTGTINDLPALYDDGGTGDYSVLLSLTFNDSTGNGYTARLGDCVIKQYMLDNLSYTPGLIFTSITDPYAQLYSGWRGLPYPGYQLPAIWCFGTAIDETRLNNSMRFLCDAQNWFTNKFHPTVPGHVHRRLCGTVRTH